VNIEELSTVLSTRIRQRQLIVFMAIYECKNIVAAAQQMALSQSTLSKALAEMERVLELRLFVRLPRGVRPTPIGDLLYRHSKLLISHNTQLAEGMVRLISPESGQVIVGCGHVWDSLVAKAVAAFKVHHPEVTVRVHFGSDVEVIQRLEKAEYDLVFGRLFPEGQRGSLVQQPVFMDPPGLLVRSDHPCLSWNDIHPSDLLDFPWLLPLPESMMRRRFEQLFSRYQLPLPGNVVECSSMLMARSLLSELDHIVTMPPRVAFNNEIDEGVLAIVDLVAPHIEIPVGFTFRKGLEQSDSSLAFCDMVRTVLGPDSDSINC